MKSIYLIFLFLIFSTVSESQIDTLKHDSLQKIVRSSTDENLRAEAYAQLGILFEMIDKVKALDYADSALILSRRIKNGKAEAEALIVRGNVYWYLGDMEKTMRDYLSALKIREKLKDTRGIGITKYNISLLFSSLENNKEALRYAFESQEQFEDVKYIDDLCMGWLHISVLYDEAGDQEKRVKYLKEALRLLPKLKDQTVIAFVYNDLGVLYSDQKKMDSVLICYQKAFYHDSLALNSYGMTKVLNNLGMFYGRKGDFKKAIEYTSRSVEIAEKNNIYLSLKYSYANLAGFYEQIGDFQNAFIAMTKYQDINKKLYKDESQRLANEMEAKFQDEKKQLVIDKQKKESEIKDVRIAKQEEESRRKNQQLIFIGVGLVLMLLISINIFRNLQRKKRDNALITSQKEEIFHQKEELQEKHTEIKDSIDYAKRIQTALLTSDEYWNEISDDHFILFQPKDVVSGDFFWAFQTETPKGKIAIWCAADCTGHGVPGAFMSMLGISFLNEIVVERKITDASEILEKLREKIINALVQKKGEVKQRDGMDIALCVWNKSKDTLEFAGANNPLWILRKCGDSDQEYTLLELKPDKIPVGQYGDTLDSFTNQTIQLNKGDMIYSFSDGFSDQFGGPQGKKLRSSNFKNILLECAYLTGSEQKTILAEKFQDWKGKIEQIDDVCVIGIRIK